MQGIIRKMHEIFVPALPSTLWVYLSRYSNVRSSNKTKPDGQRLGRFDLKDYTGAKSQTIKTATFSLVIDRHILPCYV